MARIASQSKGGFYATPTEELKKVLPFLNYNGLVDEEDEESIFNLIDPCAGEGDALKMFFKDVNFKV